MSVTIPNELLSQIERLRGREKRSTFVEHLLKLGIKEHLKESGVRRNEQVR